MHTEEKDHADAFIPQLIFTENCWLSKMYDLFPKIQGIFWNGSFEIIGTNSTPLAKKLRSGAKAFLFHHMLFKEFLPYAAFPWKKN